jgi:hypothetical protein
LNAAALRESPVSDGANQENVLLIQPVINPVERKQGEKRNHKVEQLKLTRGKIRNETDHDQ